MVCIDEIKVGGLCDPGKYIPEIYHLDREVRTILSLLHPDASERERFGCVQTLKFYGCTLERTIEIIKNLNKWKNYNELVAVKHIRKAYNYKKHSIITAPKQNNSTFGAIGAPCFLPSKLCEDFMKMQRKEPILFMGNKNYTFPVYSQEDFVIKAAALQYLELGLRPVPKSIKGKFPSIKWREFSDRTPTFCEVSNWDFSNGVCLVASHDCCFLDIDRKGMDNPEVRKIIVEMSKVWHYEITPSGGMHFFGRGDIASDKKFAGEVEIIGYGALIVAAPTPGYISRGAFL